METARYFDTVNFAPRIKANALVAMGFVDTSCPAGGNLDRVQSDPGAEGSGADDRFAAQQSRDRAAAGAVHESRALLNGSTA